MKTTTVIKYNGFDYTLADGSTTTDMDQAVKTAVTKCKEAGYDTVLVTIRSTGTPETQEVLRKELIEKADKLVDTDPTKP